jgi:phytoene dehydrogenase-like protein
VTTLKTDVAVAGAGLAGLALALELAQTGRRVVLLERRRRPGGAVGTLPGGADQGIHLFLSGFTRCLALVERLGSRQLLRDLGPRCRVAWGERDLTLPLGASRPRTLLELARLGREGLHLAASLIRMKPKVDDDSLAATFWREWALSVFNAPLELLDGALLQRTAAAVLGDPRRHRPMVAATNLEELWVAPFERALAAAGVRLLTGTALRAVECCGNRVSAFLAEGLRVEARHFVWAGPPEGLRELAGLSDVAPPMPSRRLGRHIVNLIAPVAGLPPEGLCGWFGAPFQWLFPAGPGQVVLVGSGWSDENLARRGAAPALLPALLARHGLRPAGTPLWIVQRHATHLQSPDFEAARPGPGTALENLHLCGAWLRTGLPLSMESALAGAGLTARKLQFE